MMGTCDQRLRVGVGVYTIPDASHILDIPQYKLRRWLNGYWRVPSGRGGERRFGVPLDGLDVWGEMRDRAFGFHTLIEVFTVIALRRLGVSLQTIRQARAELISRFGADYPFAHQRLLCGGRRLLVELEPVTAKIALELGTNGQTAFLEIVEPFCHRVDFCTRSELAERYWPLGREHSVVVDPHHGFGRPTIAGTNITTEAVYGLLRAGEEERTIADLYQITPSQVMDVYRFESGKAA